MVLAKGLRSQSRYCWAGTDKVASRAVSILEGRDLTAFVVSFASAMRQLECKSGVFPRFPPPRFPDAGSVEGNASRFLPRRDNLLLTLCHQPATTRSANIQAKTSRAFLPERRYFARFLSSLHKYALLRPWIEASHSQPHTTNWNMVLNSGIDQAWYRRLDTYNPEVHFSTPTWNSFHLVFADCILFLHRSWRNRGGRRWF